MKNWWRFLITAGAAVVFAGIAFADTLELKDGRVLQGKYLGGTQAVLRFEVNGDVQAFPTSDIVALTFTRGSGGNSNGGALRYSRWIRDRLRLSRHRLSRLLLQLRLRKSAGRSCWRRRDFRRRQSLLVHD